MRRNNYVCIPCRYANRTGETCPTCGERTQRAYHFRIPQRHNDKAWRQLSDSLRRLLQPWRLRWGPRKPDWWPEPPVKPPFDFHEHLRVKKWKYEFHSVHDPPQFKRAKCKCERRKNRCRQCKALMVFAAMTK